MGSGQVSKPQRPQTMRDGYRNVARLEQQDRQLAHISTVGNPAKHGKRRREGRAAGGASEELLDKALFAMPAAALAAAR